jgi:molecular chaperone HscB
VRQLELRETLAEAREPAALERLQEDVRRERQQLEHGIEELIDAKRDFAAAAGEVRKLMFLDKLAAEIDLAFDKVE